MLSKYRHHVGLYLSNQNDFHFTMLQNTSTVEYYMYAVDHIR